MSTHAKTLLTEAEYLERERKAEFKSEYYKGEVFAMAGASELHSLLTGNLYAILHGQFRQRPCRVYSSEMRVRVSSTRLYTYPDIVAVCGERRFADDQKDTLLNPTFLAEILSPSTEAYDLGRKSEHYRQIESLSEYLLVAQDRIHVDLYTRQPNGTWSLKDASRPKETLELHSIDCVLSLTDLYEKSDL